MQDSTRFLARGVAALALSANLGCSARIVHEAIDEKADATNVGIRYYESSPYLIVYSNGKGGIVTQLEYLPDPGKKMSATPQSNNASLKTTLTFENGVLTKADADGEAASVPKAIVSAIKTAAPKFTGALNVPTDEEIQKDEEKPYTVPAPYIYKIVVDGSTVMFKGGQGKTDIKVTLLEQEK